MNRADPSAAVEVIDRVQGRCGELALRRAADGHFEIVANGVFLMDTRDGRSERLLVDAAVSRLARTPGHVLIGGLGVGFSLARAAADERVGRVTVVEREPAVVAWARTEFAHVHGGATELPCVELVEADLVEHVRAGGHAYDAVCLDVDNGPDWTVTPDNAWLYGPDGLDALAAALAPRGVLAVWSAARAPAFEARLRERFDDVAVLAVPVPRGEPDVVYAARKQYARTV